MHETTLLLIDNCDAFLPPTAVYQVIVSSVFTVIVVENNRILRYIICMIEFPVRTVCVLRVQRFVMHAG